MPSLAQFILVTAVLVATVATSIFFILRRAAATARITAAARASRARMDRIVQEAQELLVPIREGAPTLGRGVRRTTGLGGDVKSGIEAFRHPSDPLEARPIPRTAQSLNPPPDRTP